ncbi:MAG: SMP-30/gluconolactonase/LRE family protein [Pirellulaceae bacterium]|nr:SMP-30/gluconolactonase/LRE family protein [Pirellulaceae bacterium]
MREKDSNRTGGVKPADQPPETHCLSPRLQRRQFVSIAARKALGTCLGSSLIASGLIGCKAAFGRVREPELIWGRQGTSEGRLYRPRAIAIDAADQVYVVDRLGRIQVFDRDGKFLRGWRAPEIEAGRPTGLSITDDGLLLVADTHYHRLLTYSPDGQWQSDKTIGGEFGYEPSQFHFVTDVVQDRRGHVLAGQYGELDQIQEFDSSGKFVRRWGRHGHEIDAFDRPQSLIVDEQNCLWVADGHNHRIMLFDLQTPEPKLVRSFGTHGSGPGQVQYPYGLALDRDGTLLVAEMGNHRVQRFSLDGQSLESWGQPGSGPGQFSSPWAIAIDSRGAVHVVDTDNHRIQRFAAT